MWERDREEATLKVQVPVGAGKWSREGRRRRVAERRG